MVTDASKPGWTARLGFGATMALAPAATALQTGCTVARLPERQIIVPHSDKADFEQRYKQAEIEVRQAVTDTAQELRELRSKYNILFDAKLLKKGFDITIIPSIKDPSGQSIQGTAEIRLKGKPKERYVLHSIDRLIAAGLKMAELNKEANRRDTDGLIDYGALATQFVNDYHGSSRDLVVLDDQMFCRNCESLMRWVLSNAHSNSHRMPQKPATQPSDYANTIDTQERHIGVPVTLTLMGAVCPRYREMAQNIISRGSTGR